MQIMRKITQIHYAAEDSEVFRFWEKDPSDYQVISGAKMLNMLNAYRKMGIPCFNASRMFNPFCKIRRKDCKHAI